MLQNWGTSLTDDHLARTQTQPYLSPSVQKCEWNESSSLTISSNCFIWDNSIPRVERLLWSSFKDDKLARLAIDTGREDNLLWLVKQNWTKEQNSSTIWIPYHTRVGLSWHLQEEMAFNSFNPLLSWWNIVCHQWSLVPAPDPQYVSLPTTWAQCLSSNSAILVRLQVSQDFPLLPFPEMALVHVIPTSSKHIVCNCFL